jgi:glycine/D-amino acid oxidase-like deaminating enzyme
MIYIANVEPPHGSPALNHHMNRQTDILIIGQGICGTFLSQQLEQAGVPHLVIDEERPDTASRAAAGLINPVTGRRIVKTWMIDELLPFAREAYRQIGETLGESYMEPVSVVDFFPTPQMRIAFLQRYTEDPQYLHLPADEHGWNDCFRYDLGYGLISPCYLVDLPGLLAAGRQWMRERGVLREERFEVGELVVEGAAGVVEGAAGSGEVGGPDAGMRVRYRDIEARRVIFCDGIESLGGRYFSRLPFAPNKGEALIVEIPELGGIIRDWGAGGPEEGPGSLIFKKGISLAPWQDGYYWAGSSYEWSFEHGEPTETFRVRTEGVLKEWLKLPFRTVQHIASVRPATLERRPFVGFHPVHTAVGILNGMGTKGCSLAPYFARQLVQNITHGGVIQPDADVRRFSKILTRG